jgi:hypothetical protein
MMGHSCGVNLRRCFFVSSHTTDSLGGTIVVAGIVGGRREANGGKRVVNMESENLGQGRRDLRVRNTRHVVVGYVSWDGVGMCFRLVVNIAIPSRAVHVVQRYLMLIPSWVLVCFGSRMPKTHDPF